MHFNFPPQKIADDTYDGFTMVELLLAISIFAVGVLAIASMQLAALKANQTSRGMTAATIMAENRLEQLMTLEYDPTDVHADLTVGNHQIAQTEGYNLSWNVTAHPSIANTLIIRVTVRWWDRGVRSSVTLDTVKTEDI